MSGLLIAYAAGVATPFIVVLVVALLSPDPSDDDFYAASDARPSASGTTATPSGAGSSPHA